LTGLPEITALTSLSMKKPGTADVKVTDRLQGVFGGGLALPAMYGSEPPTDGWYAKLPPQVPVVRFTNVRFGLKKSVNEIGMLVEVTRV
jgi:hypothetical protein